MLAGAAFAQQPADPTPAQTPAPPPAATTAPPAAPSPFTQVGTDFSFLFDGYVDTNFNHPDSGYNQLRNFDYRADTLHVNMGKITIDHAPRPSASIWMSASARHSRRSTPADRAPEAFKYFEQAYVSFKPKSLHGVAGGRRRVRHFRRRRSHRDERQLELLPVAAVLRWRFRTTTSACARRSRSGRSSPAVSR